LQAEGSLLWLFDLKDKAFEPSVKDGATYLGVLNERRFGWGAAAVDLDLNGWPDLFQANGMVDDTIDKRWEECPDYWYVNEKIARSPPSFHTYADKWGDIRGMCIYGHERNRVYMNRGNRAKPQFIDMAEHVGVKDMITSRGVSAVDLNNDGSVDIAVSHMFHPPTIYKNNQLNDKVWLGIELVGDPGQGCNREAIGSTVTLQYEVHGTTTLQSREIQSVSGLLGQSSRRQIFGFENQPIHDLSVEINWCGGNVRRYNIDQLRRYHKIEQ
jgi:hypothetical protein